jgi:hypothetical protein
MKVLYVMGSGAFGEVKYLIDNTTRIRYAQKIFNEYQVF